MISISGLNKADVLAALYNASRPLGMGFMQYDRTPMDRHEATTLLQDRKYFDYLKGRVLKLDLTSDESFEERLYDRDNGAGAARSAIDALQSSGPEAIEIQAAHEIGKHAAAKSAKKTMKQTTSYRDGVITVGLDDVAEPLRDAIRKATEPERPLVPNLSP